MRDIFVIRRDMYEAIRDLSSDEFKDFFVMAADYAFYDKYPQTNNRIIRGMFGLLKDAIDRDSLSYDKYLGRKTKQYKDWRQCVLERDNYTCQRCGRKGGNLNAHHIKEYSKYPGLRYEVENGVTLCKKCHKEIHKNEGKLCDLHED